MRNIYNRYTTLLSFVFFFVVGLSASLQSSHARGGYRRGHRILRGRHVSVRRGCRKRHLGMRLGARRRGRGAISSLNRRGIPNIRKAHRYGRRAGMAGRRMRGGLSMRRRSMLSREGLLSRYKRSGTDRASGGLKGRSYGKEKSILGRGRKGRVGRMDASKMLSQTSRAPKKGLSIMRVFCWAWIVTFLVGTLYILYKAYDKKPDDLLLGLGFENTMTGKFLFKVEWHKEKYALAFAHYEYLLMVLFNRWMNEWEIIPFFRLLSASVAIATILTLVFWVGYIAFGGKGGQVVASSSQAIHIDITPDIHMKNDGTLYAGVKQLEDKIVRLERKVIDQKTEQSLSNKVIEKKVEEKEEIKKKDDDRRRDYGRGRYDDRRRGYGRRRDDDRRGGYGRRRYDDRRRDYGRRRYDDRRRDYGRRRDDDLRQQETIRKEDNLRQQETIIKDKKSVDQGEGSVRQEEMRRQEEEKRRIEQELREEEERRQEEEKRRIEQELSEEEERREEEEMRRIEQELRQAEEEEMRRQEKEEMRRIEQELRQAEEEERRRQAEEEERRRQAEEEERRRQAEEEERRRQAEEEELREDEEEKKDFMSQLYSIFSRS